MIEIFDELSSLSRNYVLSFMQCWSVWVSHSVRLPPCLPPS